MAASTDEKHVGELNKRKEDQKQQASLSSAFKSYSNPTVYHGSGFADWNNRTQHHQY